MDHEDARGSALASLTGLLDRSIGQIAEAAADGRTYDRGRIVMLSDIWDNFTVPLVRAVSAATPAEREERARAVLAELVVRGPAKRAWVLEQLGGGWVGELPPGWQPLPYRNYVARVQPGLSALSPETLAELTADYDPAVAEVRRLWVERAGRDAVSGTLDLTVGRRFAAPGAREAARWLVEFEGVAEARFAGADRSGAEFGCDDAGVTVRLGTGGLIRAAAAEVRVEDVHWHDSAAGRRADAVVPPLDPDRPRPARGGEPELGAAAYQVASVLHTAMLELRSVRYAHRVGRVAVSEICRLLAGAGRGLLAAAGSEAGMRRVYEEWEARCPADEPDGPDGPSDSDGPSGPDGQVRFVSWSAAEESRPDAALVNLALPPLEGDGPWRMAARRYPEPAVFRLELTGGRLTVETAG
ncbi:hypothetical protein ACIA8O_07230 [Kitasatospora sp. NPDC051853]|uniref:hypothetical protein n=1 Tax=Kitasatospora sp. NPDC051853 TaxID=3364058 RepID=UPI0037A2C91F